SPITKTSDHQGMITEIVNGVEYSTVDELRKHWLHYMEAYAHSQLERYHLDSLSQVDIAAAEAVFDGEIAYPRGEGLGNIEPTYTLEIHENLQGYGDFER